MSERNLIVEERRPLRVTLNRLEQLNASHAAGLEAAIAIEDLDQTLCSRDADFADGIAAFRDKREPPCRGR